MILILFENFFFKYLLSYLKNLLYIILLFKHQYYQLILPNIINYNDVQIHSFLANIKTI